MIQGIISDFLCPKALLMQGFSTEAHESRESNIGYEDMAAFEQEPEQTHSPHFRYAMYEPEHKLSLLAEGASMCYSWSKKF
jgi:hypothetical protein